LIGISRHSATSLFLEMRFNGQKLSTGTGFLAQSRKGTVLVTNRHNLTGRDQNSNKPLSSTCGTPNEIAIFHHIAGKLGKRTVRTEQLFSQNGEPLWYEHPTLRSRADIAAIPLSFLQDVEIMGYDLVNPGTDMVVGPADSVSVIGFPFSINVGDCFAIWASGFVASEPDIDYGDLPVFLIDCRARQGQSGSPVISYRSNGFVLLSNGDSVSYNHPVARLLGIYSGRVNSESDLGLVWKTSAIRELVENI
jgi:hypothetical protein